MGVDLGKVVGRSITSISCDANNKVTIGFNDGTTENFTVQTNITAVDNLIDGESRPPTSNIVYDALQDKQDSIPSFSLVQSFNQGSINVKVYSDGFYVYVAMDGSITQTTNAEYVDLTTKVNSVYCPFRMASLELDRAVSYDVLSYISPDGTIRIIRGSGSSTRTGLSGGVMYPLKSRLP